MLEKTNDKKLQLSQNGVNFTIPTQSEAGKSLQTPDYSVILTI